MDFNIPEIWIEDLKGFTIFMDDYIAPNLPAWYRAQEIPRHFFRRMAEGGWTGFTVSRGKIKRLATLRAALIYDELARMSPGLALASLVNAELGIMGLYLFGSESVVADQGKDAVMGKSIFGLGNTEKVAGSDAGGISTSAEKVGEEWVLNGSKAFITNGLIADWAIITAISDPEKPKGKRMSMFLVDLSSKGVSRKKLNKQVWIPSDLTRVQLRNVVVPEMRLLGERGRGLQQLLTIFTHSRVLFSALTLGTAYGAFDLAVAHSKKRQIFGEKIIGFQAKAFEMADLYAELEAARLVLYKACWLVDHEEPFRLESSIAKYLSVKVARKVTQWAADIFGAASVVFEHPIHKFPMDTWGSSLGEGTQDVQKLIIFREMMKHSKTSD
jgi:alkylation response protein AidB-like acyl-CoA dehydrogenase